MKKETVIAKKDFVVLAILFLLAIGIGTYSLFPLQIENGYATGVYPLLAAFLRRMLRNIPFSLGDILYGLLIIWLIINAIKLFWLIKARKFNRNRLFVFLYRLTRNLLIAYIFFKGFWGLNYNRLGISWQLDLVKTDYSKEEVTSLTHQLIDKVNENRRLISDTNLPVRPLDSLFEEAYRNYQLATNIYPFIKYDYPAVKPTLFNFLGDYLGFMGYYNPFTGEAQVRTDIPRVLIPFIACHEIAHQIGYASESEANFVGYLVASASADPYFRYSVYNDLFSYAQSEEILLYSKEKDFPAFEKMIQYNREHLDTLVRKDRKEIREFFQKRKNRISPAISGLYDQYLKLNKQSAGVNSYNEVIGWLIAYQKKYGKL